MLRTLLNIKFTRMVKERKRKISGVVLDTNTMTKGRTPDRVKRYRKLSPEIERLVNCAERYPNCHPTRPFCKIKPPEEALSKSSVCNQTSKHQSSRDLNELKPTSPLHDLIVSLDCEMVECISATGSSLNSLARCSIVGYHGELILDLYVKQTRPVIDYRYRFSGINERILREKPCVSHKEARDRVKKTIDGKLLVGHSIHNDFQVLDLSHPAFLTIDLASKSVRSMFKTLPNSTHKYGLKSLAFNHLNRVIQKSTHCSVEDSRAAMEVFKCVENLWLPQNENIVSSLISHHGGSYLGDEYWPADVDNE